MKKRLWVIGYGLLRATAQYKSYNDAESIVLLEINTQTFKHSSIQTLKHSNTQAFKHSSIQAFIQHFFINQIS